MIVAVGVVRADGQALTIGHAGIRFGRPQVSVSRREKHAMNAFQQIKVEVNDAA